VTHTRANATVGQANGIGLKPQTESRLTQVGFN